MIRTVDKINGCLIQKVVTPKGMTVGYQVVPEGEHDASKVQRVMYLSTARMLAHAVKVRNKEIVAEVMGSPVL